MYRQILKLGMNFVKISFSKGGKMATKTTKKPAAKKPVVKPAAKPAAKKTTTKKR